MRMTCSACQSVDRARGLSVSMDHTRPSFGNNANGRKALHTNALLPRRHNLSVNFQILQVSIAPSSLERF